MEYKNINKTVEIAAAVVFFSVFVFSLLQPIADPDFFWHLKTGEWIWQHKTLPDKDPFSFTTGLYSGESAETTSYILHQYWLAQLAMFGFYGLGGFYGIIAFRCFVYLGIGLLLYFWMRRKGSGRLTSLIFLMPAFWISVTWGGERPDILSFLFAVSVIYLLEDLGNDSYGLKLVLLPLVMLLWTTVHTGFIIGDAIIVLYAAAEAIRLKKSGDIRNHKHFFLSCFASVLFTMHKLIPTVFRVKGVYDSYSIVTYMRSPFEYAKMGQYLYLLIIIAVALPLLLRIGNLKLRHILVAAFLCVIALRSVRFIPFLVFPGTVFLAVAWGASFENLTKKLSKFYIPHAVIIVFLIAFGFGKVKPVIAKSVTPDRITKRGNLPGLDKTYKFGGNYPEDASLFIKDSGIKGNMFNDFGWGGYLIWKLYPEYKVFIDGRTIHEAIFEQYLEIAAGSKTGIPAYKLYFGAYGIDFVIQPIIQPTGQVQPLMFRLLDDDEWAPVYLDNAAYIFVKKGAKNKDVIDRYGYDKEQFKILMLNRFNYSGNYLATGEMLWYMKRYNEAEQALIKALQVSPTNPIAKSDIESLSKHPETGPEQFMLN